MITFERTKDWALIKRIVTHPAVYRYVVDDGCAAAATWEPNQHDAIWYVLVKHEPEMLGLFMLVPQNVICYEIHTALLPHAWGERARTAAAGMRAWIWANTPCRRVITNVPKYNRTALRFARAAGMNEFGVNEKSFQREGQLYDQVMLGISRPENLCH